VGALIAGRLAVAGVPYLIALPLAALSTIPIGVLVGVVALRARGAALAIATLGLGLIIQDLVLQDVTWTGGQNGLAVGTFRLLGINVSPVQYSGRYAAVLILAVAAVLWSIASLRRSPVGKRLIAVRGNERAAAALGINVTVSKLYAFAIAAGIAGLAGGLIAFQTDLLTFDNFDVQQSINVIALAVIGGIALLAGPVIGSLYAAGGFFAVAISEIFGASVSRVLILASGLTTILLVVQAPDGLAGTPLPEFLRRRKRINAPPLASPTTARTAAVVARPLLVEGLDVRFGGVHAVRDLSLRVDPGTIVGLIGPNGAGKTTFIDAVSGLVSCSARQITLGEHSLIGLPAHRRAQLGLGRTFQAVELFDDLTIRDNLLAAEARPTVGHWLRALVHPGQQQLSADAAAIVELLGLREVLDALPNELSQAQRRIAAIGRSLAARPSVLLLDEPASGLTPVEGRELGRTLRRLGAESDVGILLVEHDVELVMSSCDRVVAIDFGAKLADGPPSEVRRDRQVVAAYLGTDDADEPITESAAGGRA
jgi:ABC-type branched-subunit amino acid transport system ATPase component/ABC-type branched-subunit amino acid transport system permease subunit